MVNNKKESSPGNLVNIQIPFSISVIITEKNSKPGVELRRITTDEETIKQIIRCAFHSVPIMIVPSFKDKIRSISSLIEKGIMYREGEELYFTF